MAPKPPNLRSAPAEPWRFSGMVDVVRGPDMAPKSPTFGAPPAKPWRASMSVSVCVTARCGIWGKRGCRGARPITQAVHIALVEENGHEADREGDHDEPARGAGRDPGARGGRAPRPPGHPPRSAGRPSGPARRPPGDA